MADQHDDSKHAVETVEDVYQAAVADNTAQLVALAQEYVPGSKEEKALLWKLDRRILVGAVSRCLLQKLNGLAMCMVALRAQLSRPIEYRVCEVPIDDQCKLVSLTNTQKRQDRRYGTGPRFDI